MNQIAKVRYDKSTTKFTPQEERYWLHFLATDRRDPFIRDYIKSQLMHNPDYRRDVLNQPVCERCQRFAFHHNNGVMCFTCGHFSATKTHKVKIHLAEGHYK